jgi:undecaprenyl diphosphate synthase
MDGNGRWATRRALPRVAGHRAGANAVRRIVEAAPDLGIGVLTLFAFSADNWKRPPGEVDALLRLLRVKLQSQARRCIESGMRLSVIGRRDRSAREPAGDRARRARDPRGTRLHVRVALDYSAREAIASARSAGRRCRPLARRPRADDRAADGPDATVADVDLLVRTGAAAVDFLLWECAYASSTSASACGRTSRPPTWRPPSRVRPA